MCLLWTIKAEMMQNWLYSIYLYKHSDITICEPVAFRKQLQETLWAQLSLRASSTSNITCWPPLEPLKLILLRSHTRVLAEASVCGGFSQRGGSLDTWLQSSEQLLSIHRDDDREKERRDANTRESKVFCPTSKAFLVPYKTSPWTPVRAARSQNYCLNASWGKHQPC